MANLYRDKDGTLPAYAWPRGYPLFYIDGGGNILCHKCANETETEIRDTPAKDRHPALFRDLPVVCDANWKDPYLYCGLCSERIESAYAEDEHED